MTYFLRFRYWIAADILRELETRHGDAVVDLQAEAFRRGHQEGYWRGQAHGELIGQQMLLAQFSRYHEERHAEIPEVTAADVERAKKGLVH